MVKVLFVCLGNICRSPMAEAVFRHQGEKMGVSDKVSCDSAGTAGYHVGEPPHYGTQKQLAEQGIGVKGIHARQLTKKDLQEFDYIVAMDDSNLRDIRRLAGPSATARLNKLADFVPGATWDSVPDPWYTGDFEETYRLVSEGCAALLQHIRQEGW